MKAGRQSINHHLADQRIKDVNRDGHGKLRDGGILFDSVLFYFIFLFFCTGRAIVRLIGSNDSVRDGSSLQLSNRQ